MGRPRPTTRVPWNDHEKGSSKGLSLTKFASSKQHDPTFTREAKKKAYFQKANVVKKYKRMLKTEGILGDSKLASNRRTRNEHGKKRSHVDKPDRFKTAKKAALDHEAVTKKQADDHEAKQKAIELKRKQRDMESKRYKRKTSRGQPIMKYRIDSIVNKLTKEEETR